MSAAFLGERILHLGQAPLKPIRLSVLTPFHKHDPSAMLAFAAHAPDGVEFILLDDGSASATLLARLVQTAWLACAPVRILVSARNKGRAAARNRLIAEAQGEYVLFLDADMIPDRPLFFQNWLDVIARHRPDVAFGGLSVRHAEPTSDTALHYEIFAHSDCRPARERSQAAAQTVASANLLVRKSFLARHPFDEGFVGWGFEDVDWALGAARYTEILHTDNPATHAGLDNVATLMRKSAEAGPNFARLARKHPTAVSRFAAHRAARLLRHAPARTQLRSAFAWLAGAPSAPMPLRRAAFKLYRASHFAEHLA
ncbi:MAG: glycosyltransferase [Caulobacterales bacterium]|nr:glycosyltransferase [Caulobacterales bacterium]